MINYCGASIQRGEYYPSAGYVSSDTDDVPANRVASGSSIGSRNSRAYLSSRCSSSDGITTLGDERSCVSASTGGSRNHSSCPRAINCVMPSTPFVYINDEVSLRSPLPQKYGTLRCYVERKGNHVFMHIEKKSQSYIIHPEGDRFLLMAKKLSTFFTAGYEIYKSKIISCFL